jgi:hypothetical protein
MGLEMAEHHEKIADVFEKFKKALIMISRGHGKTEEEISKVLHIATHNHDKEIMIVSASLGQSYRVLERIKFYIDQKEDLKFLRPKYVGGLNWEDWQETWSKQEIRTSTNCKIMCRPFNSSVRGNHVHFLFCDDVLRNDTGSITITPDQAKKIFVEDVYPCINAHNGSCYLIGTPMDENDLLYTIKNDIKSFEVVEQPCVVSDANGNWIRPIWNSHFTIGPMKECAWCGSKNVTSKGSNCTCNNCGKGKVDLVKLREEMNKMSPFSFEKEYLLNPISSGTSVFDVNILKRQSIDMLPIAVARKDCYYYCGVDVAMSQNDTGDYTVITILEEDENGIVRMIKYDRFSGASQTDILKRVQDWHKIFDFVKIMIEEKGLSYGMIRQANEDSMFDNVPNEIIGCVDGFGTNRGNKEKIIGNLIYAFSVGNLFIPQDTTILKELTAFSVVNNRLEGKRAHDDIVMSLAIAYECYLDNSDGNISVGLV